MKMWNYCTVLIIGIAVILFLSSCATPIQPHVPPTPLLSTDSARVLEARITSQNVQVNYAWALDKELGAFVSGNYYLSDMRGYGADAAIGRWWSGGVGRAEVYAGGGYAQTNNNADVNRTTYNLLSGFIQGNAALSTLESSAVQAQIGVAIRLSYTSLLSTNYININNPAEQPDPKAIHQITSIFLRLGYKPVAIDVGSAIMTPLSKSNLLNKPYFMMYLGCAIQM